jgi:hypothetical protein
MAAATEQQELPSPAAGLGDDQQTQAAFWAALLGNLPEVLQAQQAAAAAAAEPGGAACGVRRQRAAAAGVHYSDFNSDDDAAWELAHTDSEGPDADAGRQRGAAAAEQQQQPKRRRRRADDDDEEWQRDPQLLTEESEEGSLMPDPEDTAMLAAVDDGPDAHAQFLQQVAPLCGPFQAAALAAANMRAAATGTQLPPQPHKQQHHILRVSGVCRG